MNALPSRRRAADRAKPDRLLGFSLVEILVALAILGILTAVAFPSYQEYVRRSRRADAQAALVGMGGAMERYFVQDNTYAGAAEDQIPLIYAAQVPESGDEPYYLLRVTALSANDYTLQAQPVNAQEEDPCGILQLDAAGRQTVQEATLSAEECWKN